MSVKRASSSGCRSDNEGGHGAGVKIPGAHERSVVCMRLSIANGSGLAQLGALTVEVS